MNLACRDVLRLSDSDVAPLSSLLAHAGLHVRLVGDGDPIPGSHWGDEEAGLIGDVLHVRNDTPVHSALHEAGHWLLMSPARRASLHTDAGGTSAEENAVCLLQILLADELPPMHRGRMLDDMDAWGYSFRLGSSRAWFERDSGDAREALTTRLDRFDLADDVMERLHEAMRRHAQAHP